MLTKSTISSLRALVYLGLFPQRQPISPRVIAQALGESPTYLAKVLRQLVKAGILKAQRGVAGGVSFTRPPEQITLLAVVEACQGIILGDVCRETEDLALTCALHQAAAELHRAIVGILSRWTLADLIRRPEPDPALPEREKCLLCPGVARWIDSQNLVLVAKSGAVIESSAGEAEQLPLPAMPENSEKQT